MKTFDLSEYRTKKMMSEMSEIVEKMGEQYGDLVEYLEFDFKLIKPLMRRRAK